MAIIKAHLDLNLSVYLPIVFTNTGTPHVRIIIITFLYILFIY